MNLSHLYPFATVRQLECIQAIEKHGSGGKAAAAMGIDKAGLNRQVAAVKKRAALQGVSPEHDMVHAVPDGYQVKGVSTYYNKDGKPTGQWVKSSADEARREEIRKAALEALCEELPRELPVMRLGITQEHLCNVYTLTDSHVGMLAWHKENLQADWDLKIAEETLTSCFEQMILASPAAGTCVVNQLGDFLHYDGLAPVTPTSNHVLDSDGRFSKMVRVSIRILRKVVGMALQRHDRVILLLAEGNHDMAGSVWLRAMFSALYENEPRVTVIDSELPYYAITHGTTLLAFHHGHLRSNADLPLLFAAQFAPQWGATTKRYCHTGHRHHHEEKEHSGMTVTQHPTLAARDAYASRGGWLSERQVTSITYSDKFGLVAKNTVTPEMLEIEH